MADSFLTVPFENPNDPSVRLVEWMVADGAWVERGQTVVLVETTKTSIELETVEEGYIFHLHAQDAHVPVGDAIAVIRSVPERPERQVAAPSGSDSDGPLVTRKAKELLERHGIDPAELSVTGDVIRKADVDRYLRQGQSSDLSDNRPHYRGEPLDPEADWDRVLDHSLRGDLLALRQRMMAKFRRHVPTGTLLGDRWELAEALGFGEGTSVYDESLIVGDVRVGKQCWIGPFTVLDGRSAPLRIGDHTDVGSGAQLYTHHTITRALTGGVGKLVPLPTIVGNCCFIGPLAVIGPGSEIGDHCFVASHSYVEGRFPSHSYIAGNPARRVGRVEIRGDKAVLIREDEGHPAELASAPKPEGDR